MPRQCARTSMASIPQACGRMVARRTGTRGAPVSAGMPSASAALLSAFSPNRRAPAGSPYAGSWTGGRSCPPAGSICTRPDALAAHIADEAPHLLSRAASARARMRLLQAADEMHTPSKDLLPFRRTLPAEFALRRLPTAQERTRRQTGRGSPSMMNPSPVATLPRRSRESGTSHRRADGDDD